MTIIASFNYANDGSFDKEIGGSERAWWTDSVSPPVAALEVGAYADKTVVGNSSGSTITDEANNTKYISPTQVDLNGGGTVTLNGGNVAQAAATFQVDWEDDAGATVLSNCKFFVFDGVTPATAPTGVLFVAFERTGSAIRQGNVEGGDTDAWDDATGVGGSGNSLDMEDQGSTTVHSFFIGVSAKPTAFGTHTAVSLRVSFDVA